jgi:membrane-associated phospholipid phosphatase
MTEIILALLVIDLILPQLITSSILYMVWWVHRPFFVPFLSSVFIVSICFVFKYAFGEKKDLDSIFKTCLALTIPKYTLPSVHAALGIYFCVHFTFYYLKSRKLNILNQDPPVTNWPRFKICIIWVYFGLLCVARIYLRLNDILDLIVGSMIGLLVSFAIEFWFRQGEKKPLIHGD